MNYNQIEKEVIILKAVMNMINDMVNNEMFEFSGSENEKFLMFDSEIHCKLFNILLVDFLSKPDFPENSSEYYTELKNICENPQFNKYNSIENLKESVSNFNGWLQEEIIIKEMWFPSIDIKINLKIKRLDLITISGNMVKHNFGRLTRQAKKIRKIFENNNKNINESESLFALEDFYNWTYGDGGIFNSLSGMVSEHLNNIRWGIYHYLNPEYKKITFDKNLFPTNLHYPNDLNNLQIQQYYRELIINDVRNEPYIPKFRI